MAALLVIPLSAVAEEDEDGDIRNRVDVPPRPESHIYDDASMFGDAVEESLSAYLQQIEEERGLEIYVIALLYSPSEGIEALATAAETEWVESGEGIVFVYDLGSKLLTFASSESLHDYVLVPEQQKYFRSAVQEVSWDKPVTDLPIVVRNVAGDLSQRIADARVLRDSRTEGIPWLLPSALLGGVGLFWLSARRRPDKGEFVIGGDLGAAHDLPAGGGRDATFRLFPLVHVAERLGCRFGGGSPAVGGAANNHAGSSQS